MPIKTFFDFIQFACSVLCPWTWARHLTGLPIFEWSWLDRSNRWQQA